MTIANARIFIFLIDVHHLLSRIAVGDGNRAGAYPQYSPSVSQRLRRKVEPLLLAVCPLGARGRDPATTTKSDHGVTLSGCIKYPFDGNGISLYGATDTTVSNNMATGNGNGIYLGSGTVRGHCQRQHHLGQHGVVEQQRRNPG